MSTSIVSPPPRRPLFVAIGVFAAFVVGAVLLYGVYGKALNPDAWVRHVEDQGIVVPLLRLDLTFGLPSDVFAVLAIFVEGLVGLLLVFSVRRLWVLIPALLLSLLFIGISAREWHHADEKATPHATCGCFGTVTTRTPKEAFFQDLALLLVPSLLAFLGRPRTGPWIPRRRTTAAVVGAALAAGFSLVSPDIEALDDLGTQLKPGRRVDSLCVGGESRICLGGKPPAGDDPAVPQLGEGRHIVVLTQLDEPDFLAAIPTLNEYADTWSERFLAAEDAGADAPSEPELWIVTSAVGDEGLAWSAGDEESGRPPATFTIRGIPDPLLTLMFRRLPRSFLVEGGIVKETWRGLPPLPAFKR